VTTHTPTTKMPFTIELGAHSGGLPTPAPASLKPVASHRRVEGVVQVVIMLAVAAMAGAASFRHVHDWTMHNSPAGTGDWFGWANAMVSELIPLAAGLEARRRHRLYGRAGVYPIALIIGAVALSLTGQLAEAKPGLSGWIISAVPALGFLALVKLVLSGPTTPTTTTTATTTATEPATPARVVQLVDEAHPTTSDMSASRKPDQAATEAASPPEVPVRLIPAARFAVVQHEQSTGRAITADELAVRMSLSPAVAAGLLTEVRPESRVEPDRGEPVRVNGAPILGHTSGGDGA
jgi:hypothetical protein